MDKYRSRAAVGWNQMKSWDNLCWSLLVFILSLEKQSRLIPRKGCAVECSQPSQKQKDNLLWQYSTLQYGKTEWKHCHVMVNDKCDMCMLSTAIYTVVIQSGCSIQSHFNTPNVFLRVNNFDSGLNDWIHSLWLCLHTAWSPGHSAGKPTVQLAYVGTVYLNLAHFVFSVWEVYMNIGLNKSCIAVW